MTAKEIQKRNAKGEHLKVLQTEDGQFFVESAEGKILYGVSLDNEGNKCTCGDFAKNVKKDPNHNCKHILSVMNAIPKKEIETVTFLKKQMPKLDDRFMANIKGKDFVLYAGVLDLATQKGLLKLEVELLQFPTKENGNEAICRAAAESKTGEVFSDIGDANPGMTFPLFILCLDLVKRFPFGVLRLYRCHDNGVFTQFGQFRIGKVHHFLRCFLSGKCQSCKQKHS